jgi:hypothetical protein
MSIETSSQDLEARGPRLAGQRVRKLFLKTPLELDDTRRLIFDNLRPTKVVQSANGIIRRRNDILSFFC